MNSWLIRVSFSLVRIIYYASKNYTLKQSVIFVGRSLKTSIAGPLLVHELHDFLQQVCGNPRFLR